MTNTQEIEKYNRSVVEKYYSVEKMTDDAVCMYQKVIKS